MEKKLSNELSEVMTEFKKMLAAEVIHGSLSNVDESVKAFCLMSRLMNLCCDLVERQEELIEKLDKYLEK